MNLIDAIVMLNFQKYYYIRLLYKNLILHGLFIKIKTNNSYIENVAMFTSNTENLDHKEVKIKKIAYFKENLTSNEIELLCLNNLKNETIFDLMSKQTLKLKQNTKLLTDFNNLIECNCNGFCIYTNSNLNILFKHKYIYLKKYFSKCFKIIRIIILPRLHNNMYDYFTFYIKKSYYFIICC